MYSGIRTSALLLDLGVYIEKQASERRRRIKNEAKLASEKSVSRNLSMNSGEESFLTSHTHSHAAETREIHYK